MFKNLVYISCFFCFSMLQAQEAELSNTEIDAFKEGVSSSAQKSKTIVNTFVQLKHIDFLSDDIESSGDLYFRAPDIIKWSYTEPYEYSVIFKDKKLFINDAGKKSDINLASNKVFKKLNDLIAKSVSGDMLDESQFSIMFFKHEKRYIAKLSPKDQTLKEMFKEIILNFESDDYLVSSVKLVEPSGDYTLIKFQNTSVNKPIPDAIFSH
ncbi:LolA family protein [Aquimarina sp. M1]